MIMPLFRVKPESQSPLDCLSVPRACFSILVFRECRPSASGKHVHRFYLDSVTVTAQKCNFKLYNLSKCHIKKKRYTILYTM